MGKDTRKESAIQTLKPLGGGFVAVWGVNFASQRSGSGISALALEAKWWLCCVGVLRRVFEAIIIQKHSEADAVFGRFNWRVLVTGMIMEV